MSQSVLSAAVMIGALRANIIDKKLNIFCPMVSLTSVKRFRIICAFIIRFILLYTNNTLLNSVTSRQMLVIICVTSKTALNVVFYIVAFFITSILICTLF